MRMLAMVLGVGSSAFQLSEPNIWHGFLTRATGLLPLLRSDPDELHTVTLQLQHSVWGCGCTCSSEASSLLKCRRRWDCMLSFRSCTGQPRELSPPTCLPTMLNAQTGPIAVAPNFNLPA